MSRAQQQVLARAPDTRQVLGKPRCRWQAHVSATYKKTKQKALQYARYSKMPWAQEDRWTVSASATNPIMPETSGAFVRDSHEGA